MVLLSKKEIFIRVGESCSKLKVSIENIFNREGEGLVK